MPGLLTSALLDDVRVATSRYLATNVTIFSTGRDALVVDAPYFPDELAELPALAGRGEVQLFATHSHYDHLLARYAFPAAPLLIGRPTAEALAGDPVRPMKELAEEDARTYVRRDRPLVFGSLHGVAVPGYVELGSQDIELVDAYGHTADGTALWAPWVGVLCCGDYLSDVELPLVAADGSLDAYRATLERLAPYVEQARLVVPGHGSPCSGDAARRRLEQDLRYLEALSDGDADRPLPEGRASARQLEIHRANAKRHGAAPAKSPAKRSDKQPAEPPAARSASRSQKKPAAKSSSRSRKS